MSNDKAFALYATALIAGTLTALGSAIALGFASVPAPLVFLEHLALALFIRGAYKSVGGFDLADWSLTGAKAEPAAGVLLEGPAPADGGAEIREAA